MADLREQALMEATRRLMEGSNYDPHFANIGEREIVETKLFLARMDALTAYYQNLSGFKISHTGDLIPMYDVHSRSMPRMPDPVPMILWCQRCGVQHIDAAEDHKLNCATIAIPANPRKSFVCDCDAWQNPPHTSHLCAGCGYIWRPADVPTTGVAEIATVGRNDSPAPTRGRAAKFKAAAMLALPEGTVALYGDPLFMRTDADGDEIIRKMGYVRPEARPRWRHNARQSTYDEVARAELQKSDNNHQLQEGDILVVYVSDDGKTWARWDVEFEDGRYALIGHAPA